VFEPAVDDLSSSSSACWAALAQESVPAFGCGLQTRWGHGVVVGQVHGVRHPTEPTTTAVVTIRRLTPKPSGASCGLPGQASICQALPAGPRTEPVRQPSPHQGVCVLGGWVRSPGARRLVRVRSGGPSRLDDGPDRPRLPVPRQLGTPRAPIAIAGILTTTGRRCPDIRGAARGEADRGGGQGEIVWRRRRPVHRLPTELRDDPPVAPLGLCASRVGHASHACHADSPTG
jgi:hypothetical protein